MISMFWTNEKLSLIVAGSSSVSITCSKVQSSGGNSWCPCSSAHEIRELSEWSDILSWDLEHNLPQVELISIVGCSAFTELSPSLGSFIELWNISFGFLSILSPSDGNIDLRQAFQFQILMTPNERKGWGLSAKLGKHSAIWEKLGTALQAYALNPCTKFPPNPTSRKVNT